MSELLCRGRLIYVTRRVPARNITMETYGFSHSHGRCHPPPVRSDTLVTYRNGARHSLKNDTLSAETSSALGPHMSDAVFHRPNGHCERLTALGC